MKIVIVGDGKVGYTLTEQLSKENHDIVVIDNNAEVLEESLAVFDVQIVHGNGASLETQRRADVANSDLLIAATSSDEVNLLCCILSKKLGCRHNIARVRNREYASQLQFMKKELGLSMTINPELAAAKEIYRIIQFPSFLKLDSFAKGRVELVELKIKEGSKLIGVKLEKLSDTIKMRLLVCAVQRGDDIIIPKGGFVFEKGDKISVTAPTNELANLIKKLGIHTQKIRDVLIIGGGRIAEYLTHELIASGISVKIIEQDMKQCEFLAEKFSGAIIIHGDGTRQELLIGEGIEKTDAVISLTNIDEENLIISLFADYKNVAKTITKIDRSEYTSLFRDKGIGSIVCPKLLTSHEILRYVRAMENTDGGSVITLHRIVDDKVEALEFLAVHTTRHLNIRLMELTLKQNILIACINRMGKIIIPQGSDCISEGDTVIVIAPPEDMIRDLNDIFEEDK